MKINEILTEGVAGPKSCWPGHRKVGTKPGTGKNKGKRVNDCEKIKEDTVEEGYGRYYCSTDKKWKERKGPKQTRESVNIDENLSQEFDMIERIIEGIADQHSVDAELVWEDLSSLSDDELYVFAVTQELVFEDWQKANKKDKTDGMSKKAVNAYRRENPGSKLKTAVTTKPSKLKKGSKASKRRSSYCSRSRGQMKMHNISCAKTPDKAICKARRRWNC